MGYNTKRNRAPVTPRVKVRRVFTFLSWNECSECGQEFRMERGYVTDVVFSYTNGKRLCLCAKCGLNRKNASEMLAEKANAVKASIDKSVHVELMKMMRGNNNYRHRYY